MATPTATTPSTIKTKTNKFEKEKKTIERDLPQWHHYQDDASQTPMAQHPVFPVAVWTATNDGISHSGVDSWPQLVCIYQTYRREILATEKREREKKKTQKWQH